MLKLLKLLTVSALIIFYAGTTKAQSLKFCEKVYDDGTISGESTSFTIGSDGGYLDLFVTMYGHKVNSTEVKYKIYYRRYSDDEWKYDNTIYQDVNADWVWFWKEVTFYNPGYYYVYVYDEDGYKLAESEVKISLR